MAEAEPLDEAIRRRPKKRFKPRSVSSRIKSARKFKVRRVTVARKRKLALRRAASFSTLKKRARRSAIGSVKRALAGGKSVRNMSYAQRRSIEARLSSRKHLINSLAKRGVVKSRTLDRARRRKR